MIPKWNLRLIRGIIEDGNTEFHLGDSFRWPVTFCCDLVLTPSSASVKSVLPLVRNQYRVDAEVLYISSDSQQAACILDFGIRAISELGGLLGIPLPAKCKVGDYVGGVISLELAFCTVVHPFQITYDWRVDSISAELTGIQSALEDAFESDYRGVVSTGEILADTYILHCVVGRLADTDPLSAGPELPHLV